MTERDRILRETFRKGSKTYFNSSIFFPERMRDAVFRLYGFVRTADNFVDDVPQDGAGFHKFCVRYRIALAQKAPVGDVIIDEFVSLSREKGFDPGWTDAFLFSMGLDLVKKRYETMSETLEYIYGSAEVIGLYMAKIMGLPESAHESAKLLGRAMQYINFIRDINEDNSLGRTYLPLNGILPDLTRETADADPERFASFIRNQIGIYQEWQSEAVKGFHMIPYRARIAIKTASDMYHWTSRQIHRDPMTVFDRKVKPSKARIIGALFANALTELFRR